MILLPYSFDGNLINNGTSFEAWLEILTPPVAPVQLGLVQRAQNFPKLSTKRLNGNAISVYVKCLGTAHSQIQTLKQWFNPYSQELGRLVVVDITDSNRQYFWDCTVTDIPEIQGENVVQINLFAPYPILAAVSETTVVSSVASGNHQIQIAPGGNYRTPPRIEVTPTSAKTSNNFAHRRFLQIVNRGDTAYPELPFDVTDGGIDTAALVAASQLQPDMDDLRLLINGAEVDFWPSSWTPGTNTLIFANLSFEPGRRFRLNTNIAATGAVTDISVDRTTGALKNLKLLPSSGILLIGNERFTYTSIDLKSYQFRGCTRAAKGSSMEAHAKGDLIYWVQYDIYLVYGNASASRWVPDDTKAPMFDVSLSTNAEWVFTQFASRADVRTAEWKGAVSSSSGKQSLAYSGYHGDDTEDPATSMGMAARAWQKSGRWQGETAQITWRLYHPAGFTEVSSDGEKYRHASSWPGTVGLQRSSNGDNWSDVWLEGSPSAAAEWQAWAHASSTFSASKYIRFILKGSISAAADNHAMFEVQNCSVKIRTSDLPEVTLAAAENTYYLDLTLANETTGEWLAIRWPMSINDTLVIDCEHKEITHSDGTNAFAPMELSSIRAGWLDLLPGVNNVLTYADTGTSTATVRIHYRDRQS